MARFAELLQRGEDQVVPVRSDHQGIPSLKTFKFNVPDAQKTRLHLPSAKADGGQAERLQHKMKTSY